MNCFCFSSGRNDSSPTKQTIDEVVSGASGVKFYTYKELRVATKNFNATMKIGEGGFGSVYKGRLSNGTEVAVKVLSSESRQGLREFLTELIMISNLDHENLVKLYGCCIEENNRILVYGFLENNSLAHTLLGKSFPLCLIEHLTCVILITLGLSLKAKTAMVLSLVGKQENTLQSV